MNIYNTTKTYQSPYAQTNCNKKPMRYKRDFIKENIDLAFKTPQYKILNKKPKVKPISNNKSEIKLLKEEIVDLSPKETEQTSQWNNNPLNIKLLIDQVINLSCSTSINILKDEQKLDLSTDIE